MGTGGLSKFMEIGALHGTSKLLEPCMCGNNLTNIDFDFPPTMEGARSQISPSIYVNSRPSVSKVKVMKSDSLRILYYNARSLLHISWMNYLQQLKLMIFLMLSALQSLGCVTILESRKLQFQTTMSFVMIETDLVEASSFMLRIPISLQSCLVPALTWKLLLFVYKVKL